MEIRIQGRSIRRGELRLPSPVFFWLLVATLLAPATAEACQDHGPGIRSVVSTMVGGSGALGGSGVVRAFGAAVLADGAPGDPRPVPSHGDESDRCCCPAPCSGCATGFTTGSLAANPDDLGSEGPEAPLSRETGPVASDDPFFLPFAIPPPRSV